MLKLARQRASTLGQARPSFWKSPPFWAVFPLAFVAVLFAHWPLLRLPYYCDEAGYYIPAAFDFFRTGALTAVYPVFCAQSSCAHADLFAAAATLWALAFFLDRRIWLSVLCFSLAALSKETSIVTPFALAAWQAWIAFRTRSRKPARNAALLLVPVLPLCLWYLYHWHRTGFIFGNPQYLRYNAEATLTPLRVVLAFLHRAFQLTLHMNLFVLVLPALAALLLDPAPGPDGSPRPAMPRDARALILVVVFANAIFFSILGGALLTRYLLPLYPLVVLLCLHALRRRLNLWPWLAALAAAAFVAAL